MTGVPEYPSVVGGGVSALAAELASKAASLVGLLVIASYLRPDEFGLGAIALLSYAGALALFNPGTDAMVHALGDDDADGAIMGVAVATGLLLTGAVAVLAGPISRAFNQPDAGALIALIAPAIALRRVADTTRSFIERDWAFRRVAFALVVATLAGAAAAAVAAARGLGARALVVQVLVSDGLFLAMLMRRPGPWHRPTLRLLPLGRGARFGRESLLGNALIFGYTNLDDLFVSRLLGASALGTYSFAYRLASLPTYTLAHALNRVLLPTYRWYRQRERSAGALYLGMLRLAGGTAAFALGGLLIHAPTLIDALYGDRWAGAYAPLRVMVIYGLFRTYGAISGSALLAHERPEVLRRIALWQVAALLIIVVPATMRWNVTGTAVAVTLPLVAGVIVAVRVAAATVGAKGREVAWSALTGVGIASVAWLVGSTATLVASGIWLVGMSTVLAMLAAGVLGWLLLGDDVARTLQNVRENRRPARGDTDG